MPTAVAIRLSVSAATSSSVGALGFWRSRSQAVRASAPISSNVMFFTGFLTVPGALGFDRMGLSEDHVEANDDAARHGSRAEVDAARHGIRREQVHFRIEPAVIGPGVEV